MSPTVFRGGREKEGKEIYLGGGQDEGQWVDSEGGELLICLPSISQPLVWVTAVSTLRDPPLPCSIWFWQDCRIQGPVPPIWGQDCDSNQAPRLYFAEPEP